MTSIGSPPKRTVFRASTVWENVFFGRRGWTLCGYPVGWALWGVLLLGLIGPATVEAQTSRRPTASGGLYGSVEVRSFSNPGGKVKVWWATHGPHTPWPADGNANGVPDFVELVAKVGDEVQTFVAAQGLRQPLSDATLLPRADLNGGDGLLDVYLIDFSGGDGQYVTEACDAPQASGAQHCVGFLLLENDFSRGSYKNAEEAIRVVLTHEYFHALQSAYRSGLPAWFSEGSATWFEEFFYPAQSDFEHLTSLYFQTPERTLSDRSRGPSDGFAYGAAIFFYFLEQRFGYQVIPAIMEAFEKAPKDEDITTTIQTVLQARKTSLEAVFTDFAIFNAFTGRRAVAGRGYPQAERFQEVPLTAFTDEQPLNWNVSVKPLAARYALLTVTKPISLQAVAQKDFPPATVYAIPLEDWKTKTSFLPLSAQKTFFSGSQSPLLLILPNGGLIEETGIQVQVRFGSPPSESPAEITPEATAEPESDAGISDTPEGSADIGLVEGTPETTSEAPLSGCSGCTIGLPAPWLSLAVFSLWLLVRRRRRERTAIYTA